MRYTRGRITERGLCKPGAARFVFGFHPAHPGNDKKEEKPVKKIIRKKEYDTETATLVKKYTVGSFGDPAGYEETLYQTPDGFYFVYGCGGTESPYAEESIQCIAKTKVDAWLEAHN